MIKLKPWRVVPALLAIRLLILAPVSSAQPSGLSGLLPPGAALDTLASGFDWSEGPVWVPDGGFLLFSDIPRNSILRWKEGTGLTLFMRPAGYNGSSPQGRELGTNALLVDTDGHLLAMDHGNRGVARIDTVRFTREMVAERFEGRRLNSPNDAVFSRRGDLYFTDPPYGLDGLNESAGKELPFNGVYRLSREGVLSVLATDLTFPNGIGLSPDGSRLYVANSDPARPVWMEWPILDDGTLGEGRVFYDASERVREGLKGMPDGFAVDKQGRIVASGPGGLLFFDADGTLLGTVETPTVASNVAFGGPDGSDLFITADNLLLHLNTLTSGLPWAKVRR